MFCGLSISYYFYTILVLSRYEGCLAAVFVGFWTLDVTSGDIRSRWGVLGIVFGEMGRCEE